MWMFQAVLERSKIIAPNIYELEYSYSGPKDMIPGQFITFILPGIGGRAYSVLEMRDESLILIIKRWSPEMGGRWGSLFLCDAKVGQKFNYVGPSGHFTLSSWDLSRCFLGTGTGFVPLYNQILWSLKRWDVSKIHLVFWVRTKEDLFYIDELKDLSRKYAHFDFEIYLSREETGLAKKWYVTDFLKATNISDFEEFYMCGAPSMIESCETRLIELWIAKERIFFEKY